MSRLEERGRAADDTPSAQRFIEDHSAPDDRVLLIGTPVDHRLADQAGVVNVSPLNSVIALISADEADRSMDQLREEGGKEVFEAVTAHSAVNPYWPAIPEFAAILQQHGYRLVMRDPSSGLRLWRRAAT